MPQMPKTCSTVILWGALALGLASSLNAFAAKKIIPLQATTTEQTAEDVIYQMARVPTSNASTYLKNLTCANGVFGREIRYTIVKGSLAGHSKKQLFIRTYQTDANGYMRPWSTDNYRWHPFNAGQQDKFDLKECVICMEGFKNGEDILEIPTCGHFFHSNCCSKWFLSQARSDVKKCPLCNEVLNNDKMKK